MIFAVVALVLLTSTTSITKGFSEEQSQYVKYRNSLITYQPQFTVEGNKMILRSEAINKMNQSKNTNFNLCFKEDIKNSGGVEACNMIPGEKLYKFQTTDFDWYTWYERVDGYSRFSPIKTFFAKFPRNSDNSQTSYSLFSFQGFWILNRVNNDLFDFMEYSGNLAGAPEKTYPVMMFQQHKDYPLLFDIISTGRYGMGTTWYYNDNELTTFNTSFSSSTAVIKYSLVTGEVISKKTMSGGYGSVEFAEEIQGLKQW